MTVVSYEILESPRIFNKDHSINFKNLSLYGLNHVIRYVDSLKEHFPDQLSSILDELELTIIEGEDSYKTICNYLDRL